MKLFRVARFAIAVLASWNLILPMNLLQAAAPAAATSSLSVQKDLVHLALSKEGRLIGQLVDPQGKPLANRPVNLFQAENPKRTDKPIGDTTTDKDGRFQLSNVKSGVYVVVANDSAVVCRCWSGKAVPPAAKKQILLVSNGEVQRGQRPIADMIFAHPVILTLLIVAAIAIPIAIHNSQDDAS